MKIVIADELPASAIALLRNEGWIVTAEPVRPIDQLITDLSDADALIVRSATKVTSSLIEAAPKLRAIARAGTGVDNVDVGAASEKGIIVMNAPGANSVSVAELAIAFLLGLARHVPAADATMKQGKWNKRMFMGEELRDKTLGLAGLGRIGQEVCRRARAFEMRVIAHDPFIAEPVADDLGAELVTLDDLFSRSDYLSLHLPSTDKTRHIVNAKRLAQAKKGIRIVNTARGDLIDEIALTEAIKTGHVGGAALDVFTVEPPTNKQLQTFENVIATPHIAASTREAQENVGLETAATLRDFLRDGIIRNAVNFPSVSAEEYSRLQPFIALAERLGAFLAQMTSARIEAIGIRCYGNLTDTKTDLIGNAVLVGLFKPILSTVSSVNARTVAENRGIEIIESQSSRQRNFTRLLSVKLHTSEGEHWVEGALFDRSVPRLVLVNGAAVEAPLDGVMIVLINTDQPGVIGDVGTILGKYGVNIATFALGRSKEQAVGVVNIDEGQTPSEEAISEIQNLAAVKEVRLVRV